MSVRFSLRFAGRSWGRLLGVAKCDEPGRESVVAIMGGGVVCGLQCCRAMFLALRWSSSKSRNPKRGRSFH